MGKGSNTTTTQSTSSADPQAASLYRDILTRAQGVASTPYQAYSGDLVAPVNSQQQAGIAGINAASGYASPYITQAAGLASGAANPLTQQQIQSYLNPYTQNVVDATTAQMAHDNATQMASLQGNQIAAGALGGNATGVAKGILAGQQGRTMASTVAGLYDKGYQGALNTAYQQYQQNPLAAGNAIANYGVAGQNAALTGATAQIGAGSLLQQNQQAQLDALYKQYAQAQAYPYQQTQWLAGLGTGVGSNLGGTSYGTSTGPAPNQTAQWLGAGLSAAGLFLNRGGGVHGYASGGGVAGYAGGGAPGVVPWADAAGVSWIPQMNIHAGSGAPRASAPSVANPAASQFDPKALAQGITSFGNKDGFGKIAGIFNPDAYGGGNGVWGGSSSSPLPGLSAADYGEGFADGGRVGYADGGMPIREWLDPVGEMGEGDPSPSDPMGAANRFAAHDLLRRGVGNRVAGDATTEPMPVFGPDGKMMGNQTSAQGQPPAPAGAPVVAEDEEEAPAPVGIAGRASAAPSGGVAAFAPTGPSSYGNMPDAVTRPTEKSSFGLGLLSPNAKTGLLTAGLGMLASRSPFLGNAVGEGGLAGLGAYGAAEANDRKIAAEAEKLSREQRQQSVTNLLNERKQGETERHNRETEKNAASDKSKAPMGMRFNAVGELEPIPGWLPTLEKAAKARKGPEGEVMDDDTAQFMADRIIAGDTKVLTGLGRGAQGAANIMKVQKLVAQRAASGEPISAAAREILQNAAQFEGLKTAERTQAGIMGKLSVYGRTAFNATDIALARSAEVPRTDWVPVNKAIIAYKTNTGDPKVVALGQALMTLTNEYARAIGGGHGTVHDKEAAEKRLNAAQSPQQLKAVIDVMRQEILAEERAMPAARQHIRDIYNPRQGAGVHSIGGEHGAPTPAGPVPGASGFQPPAGAIARTYQGKTYYYDPNTKQPYPGQ